MLATTVVIGENLVDLLVHPDHLDGITGGGPLNVARTMARLGSSASFLSGISADAFGQRIRAELTADGVTLLVPTPSPLPTTMAVVTLGQSGPSYHFHLANTASFAIPDADIESPAALYVGTLGLLIEPMASIGERLFLATPPATLTIVDPNCRPSATTDYDGYRARLQRMYARADVVKVSVEDLDYLAPGVAYEVAAQEILAAGARLVLITDGPNPVRAVHASYHVAVEVPPTEIVDTVGAGDSLTGGFISWWLGNDYTPADLNDADLVTAALQGAIEISRRTCQQAGAQPPRADDVRGLPAWAWL